MAGRPSTYNPDYCASVLAFGEKGMSVNEMAAELGHARSSLYKWAEEHPEFSDALKRAQEKALAWWENQGRLNLTEDQDGGKFNHVLWYMNMKNRHGWADKQEVTGADGGPINTAITVRFVEGDDDGDNDSGSV